MRVETPWGPWEHISPAEMASVMSGFEGSWWIGGGYAIEAFVGRHFREHGDIDVGVLRRDHKMLQVHLREWELECADPPGILRPWVPGEELTPEIHDIWARRSSDDAWRFQFMLDNSVGDMWLFRRDGRVTRPLAGLTFERDGTRYLVPEVQLLYKSGGQRPKDDEDFRAALPLLSVKQRTWLRESLETACPGHAWLDALA